MGRFLCGSILSHHGGVVRLSAGEGILCVLGNYNGNTGTGKNENWMRIGVEAPEGTNSRGLQKWQM